MTLFIIIVQKYIRFAIIVLTNDQSAFFFWNRSSSWLILNLLFANVHFLFVHYINDSPWLHNSQSINEHKLF